MTNPLVETVPLVEAVNVSRRFTRKLDHAEKIANVFGAKLGGAWLLSSVLFALGTKTLSDALAS